MHRTGRLIDKKIISEDVVILTIEMGEDLGFVGGQYIILNSGLKKEDGQDQKRAYSILSNDLSSQRRFEIGLKVIPKGVVSNHLLNLPLESVIPFSGPWGKFVRDPLWPSDGPVLIVATDTGLSASLSLMTSAKIKDRKNSYAFWFRCEDDFFSDDLAQSRSDSFKGRFSIESISDVNGDERVMECLKSIETAIERHGPFKSAFLAGDGTVLREIKEILEKSGTPRDGIIFEAFFNKDKDKNSDTVEVQKPGPGVKNMREGFTTGACSAAAAKAATRVLVTGLTLNEIMTTLPNKDKVTFALKRCELHTDHAICSIIKDAGDDPDVTHGAELTANVRLLRIPEIILRGGEGIAVVTKPGLGLDVGGPAINPVPRKNITEMVLEELEGTSFAGAEVTISVPGGEEMAKKTLNSRLGLIGGISILGTTGIVKPYSTSAWRASVVQGISVAKEQGQDTVVLTTGGKSETYAMALFPKFYQVCFIQVGDFIGASIKASVKHGLKEAIIVGMMGKLSKMADGRMMTHAAGSDVNIPMLAKMARAAGLDSKVCDEIEKANTARHVLELCQAHGFTGLPEAICRKVVRSMKDHAGETLDISVYLVDFNGTLLAQASSRQGDIA